MKTINSLLITAILLITTVMTWTYFAVRSEETTSLPQVGIGGGPESNANSPLRTLVTERTILTVTHLTNLYDGLDTSDTGSDLETNTQNIGDNLKQLGTATDKETVTRILRNILDQYEVYTNGLKSNNPDSVNLAKENLQMQAMDFGNLIHKLIPTISEERGTTLMNDQNTAMLEVIDAHSKNDRLTKSNAIKKANAQSLQFTEEISVQPTP